MSGARNDGGFVAAAGSLCSEVSNMYSTGATKISPMIHAATPAIVLDSLRRASGDMPDSFGAVRVPLLFVVVVVIATPP